MGLREPSQLLPPCGEVSPCPACAYKGFLAPWCPCEQEMPQTSPRGESPQPGRLEGAELAGGGAGQLGERRGSSVMEYA